MFSVGFKCDERVMDIIYVYNGKGGFEFIEISTIKLSCLDYYTMVRKTFLH